MLKFTTLYLLCWFLGSSVGIAAEKASLDSEAESTVLGKKTSLNASVMTSEDDAVAAAQKGVGLKLVVSVVGVSSEALRQNIDAFLEIDDAVNEPIKNPSYTRYLAQVGEQQIKQALQPFGYYRTVVKTTLDEGNQQWTVKYEVSLEKPVIINKLDIRIDGEGGKGKNYQQLLANYPLKKGDVLLQEKYTAFKNDVLAQAVSDGFFDGKFTRTEIILSDSLEQADIFVTYDTGPRYQFGKTELKQDILDQDVFERFVTYAEGEVYSSKEISNTQRDIYNSGYIKSIDVTANPDKKSKSVPVTLALHPKKNKRHRFAIGYGTDSGVRAKYNFDWRWVNRRGHSVNADIFASQKLIDTGAEYRIPAEKPATDYYRFFTRFTRDKSGDTDSTLWNLGAAYRDQKGNLTREIGVKWQQEDFSLGNDGGNIGLLTAYGTLTYRKVDNPLNIHRGLNLSATLSGAHDSLLSDVSFLQAVANAKYIRRFDEQHKVTLSGALGRTFVDDFHQLPAAYRFFTGGDKTVRGYGFEDIGDVDSSGAVIGGDKMYRMGAEYEYFFKENMAAAAFVDAGDAYSDDSAKLKVGAGVGFHYYSPIGPIKVDLAHGFQEPGDTIRLHLSIGPEM